jgi:arylformamidase
LVERATRRNATENVTVKKDIPYQQHADVDQVRLSLDLYTSGEVSSDSEKPLILYVHGGGWLGGDKASALFKSAEFVEAGYVFASANYRFRPEASLVEITQSVADAVGWLHREAREFGGDPNRIFLMGHSAGAHLVSVLGTNPAFLRKSLVPMDAISGVISLDTAVYDLPKLASSSSFHAMVFDGLQSTWLDVSPMHQIHNNPAKTPFLVFYSEGRPAYATQVVPFVEKLRLAGYPVSIHEAKGRSHEELDKQIGTQDDESTQQIRNFLIEYSK